MDLTMVRDYRLETNSLLLASNIASVIGPYLSTSVVGSSFDSA
jgi:hypothetical protein